MMNVLDVIKDCILSPCFAGDYTLDERTSSHVDATTVTNGSAFSGYSRFRREAKDSVDQRMARLYMRVWTGLGKFLAKTVGDGNCFASLDFGYFYPSRDVPGQFVYSPTLELIEKYGYTLVEDEHNALPNGGDVDLAQTLDSGAQGVRKPGNARWLLLLRQGKRHGHRKRAHYADSKCLATCVA